MLSVLRAADARDPSPDAQWLCIASNDDADTSQQAGTCFRLGMEYAPGQW